MRDNDPFLIGITVALIAVILFCIFGAFMSVKNSREFREKCIAAGGVPFQPKHDWACLKPDQLQPMKESE